MVFGDVILAEKVLEINSFLFHYSFKPMEKHLTCLTLLSLNSE